jgi:tetratricopeptide (TPR) repeat protein
MSAPPRRAAVTALTTFLLYGAAVFFFFPAGGQFTKYPHAAALYLSGNLPSERLLDFSPFYLYFLVAQQGLLPSAAWLPVALQLLAISIAAALLLVLLERFFPAWIAAVGVGVFVLSRGPLVYATVLEPEAFLLLFLIAFLHFALASGKGAHWLAGVSLALCVAIRPSVLPMLVFVPFFYWLNQEGRWLSSTSRVLIPSLLVLAALSARNGIATGSYSPLGMNPGFVFFEGNNPLSAGKSSVYPPLVEALKSDLSSQPDNPHIAYRLLAERDSGRELSTAEANHYWRRKALNFIGDHPRRYVRLLAAKAYAALHAYRWHDVGPAHRFDVRLGNSWIPTFPLAALAALALCGLVIPPRDIHRSLLIHGLLASQLVVLLIMYVSERQRLALLPGLVFLFCKSLAYLTTASWARRGALLFTAAVLTLLLSLPSYRTREDQHLWAAYDAADRAWRDAVRSLEERRPRQAAASAAISFAHAPWLEDFSRPAGLGFAPEGFAGRALTMLEPEEQNPSRDLDRAQLMIAAGRAVEAEELLRSLMGRGDRFDRAQIHSSDPRYFLALSLEQQGRKGEAIEALQQALVDHPGDPFILAKLAALTGEESYRQLIVRYFSELDAHFLIGIAKLQNETDGLSDLAELVRKLPELWRAQIYLSAALGARGDLASATRLYRQSTLGKQDPAMLEARIVPIFAAAAEQAPSDWSRRYEYGLVLAQFGRFDESLDALRAALALEPNSEIESAIAEVERMRAASR